MILIWGEGCYARTREREREREREGLFLIV